RAALPGRQAWRPCASRRATPATAGRSHHGGTEWGNPVPSGYTITRGFTPVVHPGIDLAGTPGTPIYAANGGLVIFAGRNSFGYGNLVVLIHGPFMTVYGHLQDVLVSCGQSVGTGQQIGTMGSTGNSTGPHLHFEIRVRSGNGYIPQNPAATIGF
ncbi:M23 family metallopeptidase, partial [bacterium]|nr:M23 family metallopeptidase [bacterium]